MQFSFSPLNSIDDTLGIIAIAVIFIANYLGHIAESLGKIANKDIEDPVEKDAKSSNGGS